ncbi:MAG: hypothetical protein ACXWW0_04100 [Bacteroidia bacterium]
MTRNKYLIIISIVIVTICLGFYFIDPVFKRKLVFDKHTVEYDWQVFNNSYCNYKTGGHCYTNDYSRWNAEYILAKTLIENYEGQESYKSKIFELVNERESMKFRYKKITRNTEMDIDSLIKYKEEIFIMGIQ